MLLASESTAVAGFRLPKGVMVMIIGKDVLLLLGFVISYLITSQVYIVPVFIGKLTTFLQSAMITAILIAPEVSRAIPGWTYFTRFLWWSVAGTAVFATLVYIRKGIVYIEQYESSQNNN